MESKMKRTLVKSAPELWELADDLARMEAWMAGVVGTARSVSVEVTARQPERMLAWRTSGAQAGQARIALELAAEGWGTSVSIVAQHSRPDSGDVDTVLEQLLDELGSPGRRPFTRS
jgi:hypothetical protein